MCNLFLLIFIIILCLYFFKRKVLEKICIGDFKSRYVFITGCDTGFGHFLALKLAENGIPTFAGCLTEEGKIELEKKSKWTPGKLWLVSLDVTSDKSVQKAAEFVKEELKGKNLWAVVCNAGIASRGGPDDWLTIDDYQKLFDVNTLGVIRTCHAFKPFIKASRGRFVIITSMLGRTAVPTIGPYCVSKFAAEAYADILRIEGKHFGYSVHILEPGFYKTQINEDFMKKVIDNSWSKADEKTKAEYGEEYYLGIKANISENLNSIWTRNNKVEDVIDAYYNAITSRFPRLRYSVGFESRFVYVPLALYPTRLQDLLHGLVNTIRNLPVPAASKKRR